MNLLELGGKMLEWHGGQNDPIYAVGSFFVGGHDYPEGQVVLRARASLQGCKSLASAEARLELDAILSALETYILTRGIKEEDDDG